MIILQRITIGTSIALLTHVIALGCFFFYGRLRVSGLRVALYLLFFGTGLAFQLTSDTNFSSSSLLLGLVCYFSFMFVVPATSETYFEVLKFVRLVAIGIALIALFQLATQLAGLGMFTMDNVLPERLIPQGMNYIQPISWGWSINKPNGIFMYEASAASQMIGFGLVLELIYFRRWYWIGILSFGLLGTFSGTGLLTVLLVVPVLMPRYWRQLLVVGVVVVPILAVAAVSTGWLETQGQRADTFQAKGTSANGRFVEPYTAMYDMLTSGDLHKILHGYGAGQVPANNTTVVVGLEAANYSPPSKVFIEYGLIPFLVFVVFAVSFLFGTGTPFVVSWMMFIVYDFMGGNFLLPPSVIFVFVLTGGWAIQSVPRIRSSMSRHAVLSWEPRIAAAE